MRRNSVINALITAVIATAVCVLDQVTKMAIAGNFQLEESRAVIPGVLNFTYIRNKGMAMGLLANHRWVFMVLSVAMIAAIILFVIFSKTVTRPTVAVLAMILGGGIGNMIDRFAYGYVIDFIDVCFAPSIWKWIFNVADAFVTVSAVILAVMYIRYEVKKSKERKSGEKPKNNDI